jgi:hypothetical protein
MPPNHYFPLFEKISRWRFGEFFKISGVADSTGIGCRILRIALADSHRAVQFIGNLKNLELQILVECGSP